MIVTLALMAILTDISQVFAFEVKESAADQNPGVAGVSAQAAFSKNDAGK